MRRTDTPSRSAGRVWNFSAGPAALPDAVVERVRDEFPNWNGTGMSVAELSHRSAEFMDVAARAEADLRALLSIPGTHAVLFLQGGATLQFGMVPLNLLKGAARADYFRTGYWSEKAVKEAGRFCDVNLAGNTKDDGYRSLPPYSEWRLDPDAAYVHYTSNETIHGVQFARMPETDAPLVADMSSDILSRPVDVAAHAVIYAGAQKNIGPAGLTVAIVQRDLLDGVPAGVPSTLDYTKHDEAGSMLNTPPTLAWYIAGLVFEWVRAEGGVPEMAARAERKAARLYSTIDASSFYDNPVARGDRSRMNVPFTLADPALDKTFIEEAAAQGLTNLAGHRAVGGMRASLYNAMPEAGVEALVEFMSDFERRHG